MSERKQQERSRKDKILRRFESGENEDSEGSDNQQQDHFSYGPPVGGGASFDFSSDSSGDRRQDDLHSRDPFGYDNYRGDSGSRGAVGYDPRYGPSTSTTTYSDEPLSLVMHGRRNHDLYKESLAIMPSNVGAVPSKKREQKCRLCANHNIDQLMKGHKHFCPNFKCNCDKCGITRNRQHFMKEQQRITRQQDNERMYGVSNATYEPNKGPPTAFPVKGKEYPDSRRQEMEEDLADLDMSELDAINELCKKGNKHRKGGNKRI